MVLDLRVSAPDRLPLRREPYGGRRSSLLFTQPLPRQRVRRLRLFFSYSAADRWLLLQGLFLTTAARVALTTLPTRLVLRHLGSLVQRSLRGVRVDASAPTPGRVAWAIRVPGRRIPRANCLTQALAGQVLLARYGYASQLRVGVGRDGKGEFIAHAWVEVGGKVVIGGEIAHHYVALPDFASLIATPGAGVRAFDPYRHHERSRGAPTSNV